MHDDRVACDRARKARDARFDGRFFIAVTTTRIYCRPGCPARSPRDEHVQYFPTALAARRAGFRACLRCHPDARPGTNAWMGTGALACPTRRTPRCYRIRLAFREPYEWDTLLAFLAARATPGVEYVDGTSYRRTIAINNQSGTICVSRGRRSLRVDVHLSDRATLCEVAARVGRIFDIGANPVCIASDLSVDPLLRPLVSGHTGIRVPGAWDGFELTVRAILGQQISVRGATTLAGRVASLFGTPLAGDMHLTHLFPTPDQLASAALERAGVMPSRAVTIRELARHVTNGRLSLNCRADAPAAITALRQIAGIGHWTAQYVAMRAFADPDAFPSGDLILRREAGGLGARDLQRRSLPWRPWRSYAVMLLWQEANRRAAEARARSARA